MATMVVLVDGTVPVAADFNGNFAALNAALGTGTTIAAYTAGDLLYATAANTLGRRAIGSAAQVLTVVGGVPDWAPAPGLTDQLAGLNIARTSGTQLTVAVGAAASDDAVLANRVLMNLASALQGNTAGTWVVGNNQNKLDAGSIGNAQTWHVFVIERTDTGIVDILFSQSPTAPTLPTNYTKQRRIGSRRTDGSAQFIDCVQDGDYVRLVASVLDVTATNPGTAAVTATLTSVPTGVKLEWLGNLVLQTGTATIFTVLLSDLAAADEAPQAVGGAVAAPGFTGASSPNNNSSQAYQVQVRTNTSAQIRYRASASAAATVVGLVTLGWIDRRGKG